MAKRTAAEIKEQTKKILEALEQEKQRLKSENFTQVTAQDIEKKLKRSNSPIIVGNSWSGLASPGGSFRYDVVIWNPDPTEVFTLFAHVWVGSSNIDPVVGTFLLNVDTRFARLTEPRFGGASLKPSSKLTLTFTTPVPAGIEKTNYIGNTCLMQPNWLDVGMYLDRASFIFPVV